MKNFRKVCRGEKGFTLVELLVVIVILGILAAVAAVSIMRFMSAGNVSAAQTEAKNVATAVAGAMFYAGTSEIDLAAGDGGATVGPGDLKVGPLDISESIDGRLKATYTINTDGTIATATTDASGWGTKITWDNVTNNWK